MIRRESVRRLMVLEAPVDGPDGAGGFSRAWQAMGQHWLRLSPMTTRVDSKGPLPGADLRFRALVAASPEGTPSRPQPDQRFRDGTVVYHIRSVTIAPHDRLALQCDLIREVLQ